MSQPEKDRKDDMKEESPEFKAILPDDSPPTVGEIFGDIDDYQKKIEREWEQARVAYQEKIKKILDEFATSSPPPEVESHPPKTSSENHQTKSSFLPDQTREEDRLKKLLSQVEKVLQKVEQKNIRSSYFDAASPVLALPWRTAKFSSKKIIVGALSLVSLSLCGVALYMSTSMGRVTSLPYSHTAGLSMTSQKVYVVDWFRKAMYVHLRKKGLPLVSIENIPNGFVTGFALTGKSLWTVDGFGSQLLEHSLSEDHHVLNKYPAPGKKPVGLFWDGFDFWTTDSENKTLYRLRGNDVTEVIDQFTLPHVTVTDFYLKDKKLWLLDGRSREIACKNL